MGRPARCEVRRRAELLVRPLGLHPSDVVSLEFDDVVASELVDEVPLVLSASVVSSPESVSSDSVESDVEEVVSGPLSESTSSVSASSVFPLRPTHAHLV